MPNSRSFRRVRLMWLRRDLALSCCVSWIFLAVFSIRAVDARPVSHQDGSNSATAVWTWQTVNSDFFPPPLLVDPRKKQVAYGADRQVAFQSRIATPFVVVESQFVLLILETTLHTPSGEGRQQELGDIRSPRRVTDEVFQLFWVQHVAGHHQQPRLSFREFSLVLAIKPCPLDFPHHRPLNTVLHSVTFPALVAQPWIAFQQVGDCVGRRAPADDARRLTATPTPTAEGSVRNPRRIEPAGKRRGHFADERLFALAQSPQKGWFSAIAFVERHPEKRDTVAVGAIQQLQSNLPLWPVDHVVGNLGPAATLAVFAPTFRQEQFPAQQTVEVIGRISQVNSHDAVVRLACVATPLALH